MANFFNLQPETTTNVGLPGASEAVGLQADVYTAKVGNNTGIIDVIRQLRISGNDITGYIIDRMPFCILKEYELLTNSSINSLLYVLQGLGYTRDQIKGLVTDVGGSFNELVSNTLPNTPTGGNTSGTFKISDTITSIKLALQEGITNVQNILLQNEPLPGSLKPYQNLYIRQATGFKYILPYFDDVKKEISADFSSSQSGLLAGNKFGEIAQASVKVYESFVKTLMFATPGAFIEQPKFYNLGENGPSYNITFNLINTFDVGDIQRHYDFLFLLAFQNLPYRRDLARIRLPKIYSFTLPGEIFLPYAFISSMNVEFLGNRRTVTIQHPKDNRLVKCTVPDVYQVSLRITGLNPDAGNFMVNDYLTNIQSTLYSPDPAPFVAEPATVRTTPGTPRPIETPSTSPTIPAPSFEGQPLP